MRPRASHRSNGSAGGRVPHQRPFGAARAEQSPGASLAVVRRVAEAAAEVSASSSSTRVDWASMSYSQQYDQLYANAPLNILKPIAKPDKQKQREEPGSTKVLFSDVAVTQKKPMWERPWNTTDKTYTGFMALMHAGALLAPFCFSWNNVALFMVSYIITGCLGITLSFHRQLSHRSFATPKWLEYVFAYCGVWAVQGDPTEWVSSHRYHHLHTDTPLDPHSPYEGFWWSHMGWLLDNDTTTERVHNRSNASDMDAQPFYK
jgi:stearoyl-CoA desaturase (delta-9 desaturase)